MRFKIVLLSLGALAIGSFVQPPISPAAADKTKMGCERGKEVWDASVGKCVPGTHMKKTPKKK